MPDSLGFTPIFKIVTPGVTGAEIETVNSIAAQLGRDILLSKAPADFKQGYHKFYIEWILFQANNSGWLSRGTMGVYEKTLEFKARLREWQERFLKQGYSSSAEMITGAGTKKDSIWPILATIAGLGVGFYVIGRAFLKRGLND